MLNNGRKKSVPSTVKMTSSLREGLNSSTSGGQWGHRRSGRWFCQHRKTVGQRWDCATGCGYNRGTRTQLLKTHTIPASWWCCSGEAYKCSLTCHKPSLWEGNCQGSNNISITHIKQVFFQINQWTFILHSINSYWTTALSHIEYKSVKKNWEVSLFKFISLYQARVKPL